jgi:hypothetical protein
LVAVGLGLLALACGLRVRRVGLRPCESRIAPGRGAGFPRQFPAARPWGRRGGRVLSNGEDDLVDGDPLLRSGARALGWGGLGASSMCVWKLGSVPLSFLCGAAGPGGGDFIWCGLVLRADGGG